MSVQFNSIMPNPSVMHGELPRIQQRKRLLPADALGPAVGLNQ